MVQPLKEKGSSATLNLTMAVLITIMTIFNYFALKEINIHLKKAQNLSGFLLVTINTRFSYSWIFNLIKKKTGGL